MAGNKAVMDNLTVPDPEDAYLYVVKNGLDYKVKVGGNLSLAFLGATGTFPVAQVPDLPASKITSGTINYAQIPNLGVEKITSGVFDPIHIPNLDAAKITTGTFTATRIPTLDASKIGSGQFAMARIASGTPDGTKFVRDDGTLAVPTAGATTWGSITGTLSNQTDLQNSLTAKANLSGANFTGAVTATTLRGRLIVTTRNATTTLDNIYVNTVVEKSNTTAYTYTLAAGAGTQGDVITVLNSGTAGNITVARAGGVALYKGTSNADLTVTPGTSINLYRSATADRWIAL